MSQRPKNRLQHRLRLLKHLAVPKPQDTKSCAREMARPLEIFELPIRMLAAVELDDQSRSYANEIHDVMAEWNLTAESIAAELSVAYQGPESTFGVARIQA